MVFSEAHYVFCYRILFDFPISETRLRNPVFKKDPVKCSSVIFLLVASLYAWAAMHFGSFAAVGVASLGGALLGMSNLEVKEKIAKGFESILASIPVGILLMVIGMEVNLKAAEGSILFLAALLIVVVGTKLIGCWIATNKGYPNHRASGS